MAWPGLALAWPGLASARPGLGEAWPPCEGRRHEAAAREILVQSVCPNYSTGQLRASRHGAQLPGMLLTFDPPKSLPHESHNGI